MKLFKFKPVHNREEFLALGAEEIARRAEIGFFVYSFTGFLSGVLVGYLLK